MQISPHDDLLLVIDVQNDFCPGGALAVSDGDAVVPAINRLSQRFGHVVLTQDWHPAGHSSFASSHPGAAPFESIAMPYGQQTLWPDHCVQGTGGGLSPGFVDGRGGAGDPQGFSPRDRFLFGVLRERSPDADGPGGLFARAGAEANLSRRAGDGLLRLLFGRRCAAVGVRRRRHRIRLAGRSIWPARSRRPGAGCRRPACGGSPIWHRGPDSIKPRWEGGPVLRLLRPGTPTKISKTTPCKVAG